MSYKIVFFFSSFFFFLHRWTFQYDYLDTCCFECLIRMCFAFLYCPCSAQLSMFHMERRSRNTLIINIYTAMFLCRASFLKLLFSSCSCSDFSCWCCSHCSCCCCCCCCFVCLFVCFLVLLLLLLLLFLTDGTTKDSSVCLV